MFTTDLQPNEILIEVRVPKTSGEGVAYKKHHHPASGFAVVGVAVRVRGSGTNIEYAAVGITGVSEHAYRATAVEQAMSGQAVASIAEAAMHATDAVDGIGDTYASAEYRKHLAAVLTRRALQEASSRNSR
jgi:carbon-monoxide dehydrogenase medium subunit